MSLLRSFRLVLKPQSEKILFAAAASSSSSSTQTSNFHSSSKIKMSDQQKNRPIILQELNPIFSTMYDAKTQKQFSFEDVAKKINRSEWYTAAIFYGQAKPEEKDLKGLSEVLEIPLENLNAVMGSHFYPTRGLGQFPPQDPTIYRLYECLVVYGHPLKAMIHEKFGDGIMSLIDFYGDMERVKDPAGDRVKITLNGKFLPYKRW